MKQSDISPQIGAMIAWVLLAIFSRTSPHIANITPLLPLCIMARTVFSRWMAIATTLLCVIASDSAIALVYHFPTWGYWSLFTLSAYLLISCCTPKINDHGITHTLGIVITASVFFWCWTNFGVWSQGDLYPLTAQGLIECYWMAIPFLSHSLLGNCLWMMALLIIRHGIESKHCLIPFSYR